MAHVQSYGACAVRTTSTLKASCKGHTVHGVLKSHIGLTLTLRLLFVFFWNPAFPFK